MRRGSARVLERTRLPLSSTASGSLPEQDLLVDLVYAPFPVLAREAEVLRLLKPVASHAHGPLPRSPASPRRRCAWCARGTRVLSERCLQVTGRPYTLEALWIEP